MLAQCGLWSGQPLPDGADLQGVLAMMKFGLECLLYHSVLAPSTSIRSVAAIVQTARQRNEAAGITGMLAFDGHRFCQYIEGPPGALQDVIDSIALDKRHTKLTPQLRYIGGRVRRFQNWSMGYVYVDEQDPLSELAALTGEAALDRFATLIQSIDGASVSTHWTLGHE